MSFDQLGLSEPILKAIAEQGYSTPTPIQQQAIPAILNGKDVMAAAQTGTGKTAGFTLPILERLSHGQKATNNQVRALILTPTRELAAQVGENVALYGKHMHISSAIVYGGVKINPQMMRLRRGADILIATPGRLLDLYQNNAIHFKNLEVLVLDEADRMLDMGFIHDIRRIIQKLPAQRQNLLFSATFSEDIRRLAKSIIKNPVEVSVTPRNATAKTVKQWICPVDKRRKGLLLRHLIVENNWQQVLVFTKTKHGANKLTKFLCDSDIESAAIHGNKSQNARLKALADFKNGKIQVLVATDIAARGLDIDELPIVVNHDLPNVPEDYVHRIGRTGRAGASGEAISLVSADEFDLLQAIERLTKKLLNREYIEGFDPTHNLPESKLDLRPIKPKRPKKTNRHNTGNTGEENQKRANGENRPTKKKVFSKHTEKPSNNTRTNKKPNSGNNTASKNRNTKSKAMRSTKTKLRA